MKVAFVIPTYNNFEGLKKLVSQIGHSFHIYIVNDGNDQKIKKYLKKRKGIMGSHYLWK